MITALILMHLFGGGAPEIFSRSDFRTVRQTIEEPARAAEAARVMESMNARLESLVQQREAIVDQLVEINKGVDAPEDAYDDVLDDLWQARREAHVKYIEEVFILRDNITRDEWATAFGDGKQ